MTVLEFEDYVFDPARRRLWRIAGAVRNEVHLSPQEFVLLRELVAHADRDLTKDELIRVVCKGAAVTDNALTVQVNGLRAKLEDDPRNPRFIRTVHRVGYRFVAKLRPHVVRSRRPSLVAAVIATVCGLAIASGLWIASRGERVDLRVTAGSALAAKFRSLQWIGYEPIDYDQRRRIYPSTASMLDDLRALKRGGFDGVITFRADGVLSEIPRLARQVGFAGAVMGIDPDQEDGLLAARRNAEWADAFCLGHNVGPVGIDRIKQLRAATRRPVTSTWYLSESGDAPNERVAAECDWLFLDVGVPWRGKRVPSEAQFLSLKAKIDAAEVLARARGTVVMLKMVSFPSACGYDADEQGRFFSRVVDYYQAPDYPYRASVFLSYFSAFDIDWKKAEDGYSECERHLGLFARDRRPKDALAAFAPDVYRRRDH